MNENTKVDYVLTYINYDQPEIRELYKEVTGEEYNYINNYTYIDIELVIRLIFKNMSFINNVYIVCKDIQILPENVESLIKEYNGRIIRVNESSILPKNFITFSSACIEMFIWKIKGLSEYFIYGCDDMIPILPLNINMFFEDDKVVNLVNYGNFGFTCLYHFHCSNSTNLIFDRHCNNYEYNKYYASAHTFRALRKSLCKECYNQYKKYILSSLSPIRYYNNFNMDLYILYILKTGLLINQLRYRLHFENYNNNIYSLEVLLSFVLLHNYETIPHVICVNDTINDTSILCKLNDTLHEILLNLLYN